MKALLSCLYCSAVFLLCLVSSDLLAADWHVKPSSEVPLRRGQGTEFKIDAVISDGTLVSLLEVDGDWAKIQLGGGKEGWILKRYLSDEKPLRDQVVELVLTKVALEEKLIDTENQLTELMQVHSQTEQDLNVCMDDRGTIKNDYVQLQQDTADVVLTKKNLIAAETQLSELENNFSSLQMENKALKNHSSLIWFLSGSGVLLLGLLIGVLAGKRSKKRYSSLL
jgi:SH3 domain protein